MAAGTAKLCRSPLVFVLGCTGTGKSKLAIEIGKRIGGEIISADSMQVYQGLDIVTNKVTAEERAACPHHILDFVPPLSEFSVVEFRDMALPLIDNIMKRSKIPIIVGGTNYYIESLLWEILVDKASNCGDDRRCQDASHGMETRDLLNKRKSMQSELCDVKRSTLDVLTGEKGCSEKCEDARQEQTQPSEIGKSLYDRLMKIDPITAERLHPNDTRKIARSLQIYEQHGVPQSQLLEAQKQKEGGNVYGGPLRFGCTCVFWLQCQKEVLDRRLDKRVDEMLERGLLKELLGFHQSYNQARKITDSAKGYTEGIFQAIGFKEFHEFLVKQEGSQLCEKSMPVEDRTLLASCVESMKCVTRRYAKKQILWIKNRFLTRPPHASPDVYGLDATDLTQWEENVLKAALKILDKIVDGKEPSMKPLPRAISSHSNKLSRHVCEICDNRVILGEENWHKHLISKSHKWHMKRIRCEAQQKNET